MLAYTPLIHWTDQGIKNSPGRAADFTKLIGKLGCPATGLGWKYFPTCRRSAARRPA
jgi:uncharacterized protein with GYD domain